MSLGANRDYKSWNRIVKGRLEKHHARMDELMKQDASLTTEQASKQAYQELFTKKGV